MLQRRIVVALCAILATSVLAGNAMAGGGNSDNAKLCQKNGWAGLTHSDGSGFANQDECVSYGAHGGVIALKPGGQAWCESIPGVYTVSLGSPGWVCTVGNTLTAAEYEALIDPFVAVCHADGGGASGSFPPTGTFNCTRPS